MDQHYTYLLKILSAAIRGQIPPEPDFEPVDWDRIFSEAAAHEVHTLLYPTIHIIASRGQIFSPVLEKWKKICLLSAAKQLQYMNEAFHVLKALQDSQIPVIILKGFWLRELYPQPELRTMGDVDILVKPENVKLAESLIEKLGYSKKEHSGSVKAFCKINSLHIELHYALLDSEKFKNLFDFEQQVWDHAQQHTIGGQIAFNLSCEDNLIYLLLHMAKHFLNLGFGLRQLCDVCLYVENYAEQINWPSFWLTVNQLGYETFAMAVFETCRQLLGLKAAVPVNGNNVNVISQETVLFFIKDVISSGVYGRKTEIRSFGNNVFHEMIDVKNSRNPTKGLSFFTFISTVIFPPRKNIRNKYTYIRKYPLLLPIAWLHRLLDVLFVRGNSPREIFSIIKNAPDIAEQRTELIKRLEL